MKNIILNVWDSKNTVFTVNELSNIIEYSSDSSLRSKITHYTKRGYIERIAKWLYVLPNREVNIFELVNKIYSPSYISFFTALYHYWIIFQANPSNIFLAYKKSGTKKIEKLNLEISFKNLKQDILLNTDWLIFNWNYTIASPERAFLDTIYLYSNIYIDNLDLLKIWKIRELIPIYKRDNIMNQRVKKYFPNI